MYGICNHCGHQEESQEAFCPKCKHPWSLFPKKPKDTKRWIENKGWFNRIKRSLPPWAVAHFLLAFFISLLLIPLNLIALYKEVYITQLSSPLMWLAVAGFDAFMSWYIFGSMRLSLRKFRWARILITFNLGGTTIAFIHNWTQVHGHHIFAPAGMYLSFRFFILLQNCYVIWLERIENAIIRHGSPSS